MGFTGFKGGLKVYNKPEWNYDAHLQRTYGITIEDYNLMLEKQNHGCNICGSKQAYLEKKTGKNEYKNTQFVVDHCHNTEEIRGLLCSGCNTALGHFEKLLPHLGKVIEHLRLNLKIESSVSARRNRLLDAVQKADQERN